MNISLSPRYVNKNVLKEKDLQSLNLQKKNIVSFWQTLAYIDGFKANINSLKARKL